MSTLLALNEPKTMIGSRSIQNTFVRINNTLQYGSDPLYIPLHILPEYPFNTAHFLFAVINHSISTEHPVGNVYHPIIKSGKYGMENLYLFIVPLTQVHLYNRLL